VDQLVPGGVNGAVTGLASKLVIEPVRRPGARGDMVRFRHLLLRDAVYAAIPKARRAELHERVGDWMLAWAEDRVGEVEEIVGYHFEAAARYRGELLGGAEEMQRLARRASEYLAAAGQRAANRGDTETADAFFARVETLRGQTPGGVRS
jgi:predicted ATPase